MRDQKFGWLAVRLCWHYPPNLASVAAGRTDRCGHSPLWLRIDVWDRSWHKLSM